MEVPPNTQTQTDTHEEKALSAPGDREGHNREVTGEQRGQTGKKYRGGFA